MKCDLRPRCGSINPSFSRVLTLMIKDLKFGFLFSHLLIVGLAVFSSSAIAQTSQEDTQDTAKPADTVSPYGVSYPSGSFTYSLPLFTIGNGDWPEQITISLSYDSSGARLPNSPWTLSSDARVSGTFARYVTGFEGEPLEDYHEYSMNLVFGNRSTSFLLGQQPLSTSNFEAASVDGSSLTFTQGAPGTYNGRYYVQHGTFVMTASSGAQVEVEGGILGGTYELHFSSTPVVTLPNGQVVEFSQNWQFNSQITQAETANGLYILLDADKVCAFNLTVIDKSSITSCAQSSLSASFTTSPLGYIQQVTSITRPDGGTYTLLYDTYSGGAQQFGGQYYPSKTRHHLACIKEPGQSVCVVENTYDPCDGYGVSAPNTPEDVQWSGSRDRVIRQDFPDGRLVTYAYPAGPAGQPCRAEQISSVTITESGASTTVNLVAQPGSKNDSRVVASSTDPLQRTSSYTWTGANSNALGQNHLIDTFTDAEGREVEYTYDARGNLTETRTKAKPGSNDDDIVRSAVYPATCSNPKICNQPTSVTDANGNTSSFTYDAAHGGVLTAVGPTVDGVAPATRYYYVQREAWLKNGSGYVKTGQPIWLLSEERTCNTSALDLSLGTCAAGPSDLVLIQYDYGPDSGPNNLWLRGMAVIADGQTLRTCYSYDELGRRISGTQPNANLTSCH